MSWSNVVGGSIRVWTLVALAVIPTGQVFAQGKFAFNKSEASSASAASVRAGWKLYESEEGRYSILFPGTPIESETEVNTAYGETKMKLCSLATGKSILGAGHTILPPTTQRTRPALILATARDEAVKGLGANVIDESEIESEGIPGKELTLEVPTLKAACRMRLFVVGDRIHQITVTGQRDSLESTGARQFLESWKAMR